MSAGDCFLRNPLEDFDDCSIRSILSTAQIGGNQDDGNCKAKSDGEPDLPSSADPVEELEGQRQGQHNDKDEKGENNLDSQKHPGLAPGHFPVILANAIES